MTKKKWTYDVLITFFNNLYENKKLTNYLTENDVILLESCEEVKNIFSVELTPKKFIYQITSLAIAANGQVSKIFKDFIGQNPINFRKKEDKKIPIKSEQEFIELLLGLVSYVASQNGRNFPEVEYDKNRTLEYNIEIISQKYNLKKIEVISCLRKQNIIDNNLFLIKESFFDDNSNVENSIENSECIDKIINQRNSISKDFDHKSSKYNLFLFNDGTGSGKSYNVVMNFIRDFSNNVEKDKLTRQSLIFIAPQKNQITPDVNFAIAAEKADIPLLFSRSLSDLIDLKSKNFLELNKSTFEFESVEKYFDDIYIENKGKKTQSLDLEIVSIFKKVISKITITSKINLERIPSIDNFFSIYHTYRNYELNNSSIKKINEEKYREGFEKAKIDFKVVLIKLAEFFAQYISDSELQLIFTEKQENFKSVFGMRSELYKLVKKIVYYVLPFEVAKYKNTIIYLTADKSQQLLSISAISKRESRRLGINDFKVIKRYELADMISGYKKSSSANILEVIKNNKNLGDFLQQEYFEKDDENFFGINELGFSVVCDEEHVVYNRFIDEYTYKKVTEKKNDFGNSRQINIVHALSSVYRWLENSKQTKQINNFVLVTEEKNKIIANLTKNLKQYTVLNTDEKIELFFKATTNNDYGMFIKKNDYDFITSICDHVVSFSPKLIMLQDYLKKIKIILNEKAEGLLVAKDIGEYNEFQTQFSIYDFFQVVLLVLYACKDSKKLLEDNGFIEKAKENQNASLYSLLGLAKENKSFLETLFNSNLEIKETDKIDLSVAYFLTKIGFSFNVAKNIPKSEFSEDSFPIEPHIFIIRELPEVNLLQIVQNNKNKIFLMSATRGFDRIFSGNFSSLFFEEINKSLPGTFRIFRREDFDYNPMVQFVETRFENRKSIEIIDLKIENNQQNDKVSKTIYSVEQIDLNNIHNTVGVSVSTALNEDLIKKNNDKNYLENLVKNANIFNINPYREAEVVGVLNSIIHAFENKENAMIMTLSNRFFNEYIADKDFVAKTFGYNVQRKQFLTENNLLKVFEYSPIVGNGTRKLRLICFDASLGKVQNLEQLFILDPETTIVLVSSFASAGTGLNLTLKNNGKKQDFDAIYFVSSPYYTNIKTENGFELLPNQILMFKYFSHLGNKNLFDLSEGLSSSEIKRVLYKEHVMEKVKSIMQSIGRIERTDNNKSTKIYFLNNGLNNFFGDLMFEFNQMYNLHSNFLNKSIISNFSMLNKAILKVSRKYIDKIALTNNEINILKQTKNQYMVYENFFSQNTKNNFKDLINKYRSGNSDYEWVKDLNFILRAYINPYYDIEKEFKLFMKNNMALLSKTGCIALVDSLRKNSIIDISLGDKPITMDWENKHYSDCANFSKIITDNSLFNYSESIEAKDIDGRNPFINMIMKKSTYQNKMTKLVNPYLLNIIKGNIAEEVFSQYLEYKKIDFNKLDVWFNDQVAKELYELFDFYVLKNGTLYCVDTKNTSFYNDVVAKKILLTFPQKIQLMKNNNQLKNINFNFIYLNMFPNLNGNYSNGLSSHLGHLKEVNYMNFLERTIKANYDKKNDFYNIEDGKYSINGELENLI